jgi:hypothetical protein
MLTILRKYLSNFIVALVALQVLNLGLYAQDFETAPATLDNHANIINSVAEYVAEVVMQKKNAFPEKKETSNQGGHEAVYKFQPFKILFSNPPEQQQIIVSTVTSYNIFSLVPYTNRPTDIVSPPPKAYSFCLVKPVAFISKEL